MRRRLPRRGWSGHSGVQFQRRIYQDLAAVAGTPSGIAVDGSGNIFVTEATGDVVESFSSTGQLLATFGSGYLNVPQGIAVAPNGTVYVSSRANGNVTEYSNAGVYEGVFVSGVTDPYGLLVNAASDVFLASSNGGNQILEYSSGGTLLNTMNLPSNSTPVFLAEPRRPRNQPRLRSSGRGGCSWHSSPSPFFSPLTRPPFPGDAPKVAGSRVPDPLRGSRPGARLA